MQIKNQEKFDSMMDNEGQGYPHGQEAVRWAGLMEDAIEQREKLEDCAEPF